MGDLPSARQALAEAREADPAVDWSEVEREMQRAETGMKAVQHDMAKGAYERCVEELRCCRDICCCWRMPFVLLLQCFVTLERAEEGYALVSKECHWFRELEKGEEVCGDVALVTGLAEMDEVKAEVDGFDETFVYLVLLVLMQMNHLQSAAGLCQLVRNKPSRRSNALERVMSLCERCYRSQERASHGQYSEVEKELTELTELLEEEESVRVSGIHIGSKMKGALLIRRATARFKQGFFREACGDLNQAAEGHDPLPRDVLRLRGECYVQLKEYSKGVSDLKECLAMEPDADLANRIKEALKAWEESEKPSGLFGGIRFSSFHSPRKETRAFHYDAEYGRIKTEYEEACELLGVSAKDSIEEVRRRFHSLALHYHPDKNPDREAQDRFIELRKAYEYILQHHSCVCSQTGSKGSQTLR